MPFIIFFTIIILFFFVIKTKKNINTASSPTEQKVGNKQIYFLKSLMTEYEKYFFDTLQTAFGENYLILPQVNLATFIKKQKEFERQFQNELYRNIDFGIFDKQTLLPYLLIELNDKTHNESARIKRDNKVKAICNDAKIKLITFYTNMPNKQEYIINRINEQIKKSS